MRHAMMPNWKMVMRSFLLSLCFMSNLAHAEFVSGAKLNQWSDADERVTTGRASSADFPEAARYYAYVAGVVDSSWSKTLFCVPSEATAGQLMAIATKYIKAHPEKWTASGAVLITLSLMDAFPCANK